jgi:hypothetical protein
MPICNGSKRPATQSARASEPLHAVTQLTIYVSVAIDPDVTQPWEIRRCFWQFQVQGCSRPDNPLDVLRSAMDEGSHVMDGTRWLAPLVLGLIISGTSLAQQEEDSREAGDSPETAVDGSAAAARTVDLLYSTPEYSELWRLRYPVELTTSTTDWPASISEVDFKDASWSSRMGELRNLSLVTLLEVGQRRLFLGVNDDGLVGIHFKAFSRDTDSQYLEMVRMPYLDPETTEAVVSTSEPDTQ